MAGDGSVRQREAGRAEDVENVGAILAIEAGGGEAGKEKVNGKGFAAVRWK